MLTKRFHQYLFLFLVVSFTVACDKKVTYGEGTPTAGGSGNQDSSDDLNPNSDDAVIRDRVTPNPIEDNSIEDNLNPNNDNTNPNDTDNNNNNTDNNNDFENLDNDNSDNNNDNTDNNDPDNPNNDPDNPVNNNDNTDNNNPDDSNNNNNNNDNPTDDVMPSEKIVEQDFNAGKYAEASQNIELENNTTTTIMAMKNEYREVTMENTFRQKTQLTQTEQFTQGIKQDTISESFQSQLAGVLDILIVMDNSPSMFEEQLNFGQKFEPLLSEIANSNWQIGVVDTDVPENSTDNTCLRGFLKKGDANSAARFSEIISVGDTGSGIERGVLAAKNALECNDNWLRPNASLAIIVVSDEDNCSRKDFHCKGKEWDKADYLINALSKKYTIQDSAKVYGLFHHPSISAAQCNTALNVGHTYAELVERTSGTWGSICSDNYSNVLKEVSKDIKTILKNQFTLAHIPEPGTVKVFLDNSEISTYQLSEQTITLDNLLKTTSELRVSYKPQSNYVSEKALMFEPEHGSVKVRVNGVALEASKFQVTDSKVFFLEDIAENGSVVIEYLKKEPLPKEFDIGKTNAATAISVKVDLVINTAATFNASTGILSFPTPPASGAFIQVSRSYKELVGPVLSYSANTEKVIRVVDAATNNALPYSVVNSKIVFDIADFVAGKEFKIVSSKEPDSNRFELGHKIPNTDSINVELTDFKDQKKPCEKANVELDTNSDPSLVTIRCSLDGFKSLTFSYTYLERIETSFPTGVEDPSKYTYKVFVDGKETTNFDVGDKNINIKDSLTATSKIKTIATPVTN